MVVTNSICESCGYEWRSRGKSRVCPSCHRVLGETKIRNWEHAEAKLAKLLISRGWSLEPTGGRKVIDICAKRNGKKLFLDVKSGRSYHIRCSQLKYLLKHRGKVNDVGFACEMNGKFYLLMLKDVI
jgi:hypothetical protein